MIKSFVPAPCAPGIAAGGFHSQAGWIAFNLVALGFCLALRRVPWLMQPETIPTLKKHSPQNPTAPYLIPFLAILAAAMISGAASADLSGFIRWFFAAVAALWYFRRAYADLDWRFGWFAPVLGFVVLAIWLGLDRAAGKHAASAIGSGLAALPVPARVAWLTFRTLAAVVTVPIAEELAFRRLPDPARDCRGFRLTRSAALYIRRHSGFLDRFRTDAW